jgi:hypothetical protein
MSAVRGLGVGVGAASLLEEAAHSASDKPLPAAAAKNTVEPLALLRGPDLDFERDRDTAREINL